jgi:hypothetical protein
MTVSNYLPGQIGERQALSPYGLRLDNVFCRNDLSQGPLHIDGKIGAGSLDDRIGSPVEHRERLKWPNIDTDGSRFRHLHHDWVYDCPGTGATIAPDGQAVTDSRHSQAAT